MMIRDPIRNQQTREPFTNHSSAEIQAVFFRQPWHWTLLVAGVITMMVVAFAVGRSVSAPCQDLQHERQQVRQLLGRGKTTQATGLADLQLTASGPCDEAKQDLGALRYRAAMDEIMQRSTEDGDQALQRWREAEQQALLLGVAVDSPMVVADQAYRAGLWQLARAALAQAWMMNQDPSIPPLYYATSYNWAKGLLQRSDPNKQQQGLIVLRTACELTQVYHLAQREACQDLNQRIDGAVLPPPLPDDPLLLTSPRQA